MIYAPNVLHFSKPTCGEVTLEDEGDGEVEEHVGDPGDPSNPEQLPVNQLDLKSTIGLGEEERKKTCRAGGCSVRSWSRTNTSLRSFSSSL